MKIEGWRLHESGFTLNPDLDEQAKHIDKQLKHDIIDQRNSRMGMRIHNLIKEHPQRSFLFALGAGKYKMDKKIIQLARLMIFLSTLYNLFKVISTENTV